jgi:hyperosmotically inducible periplasmic protein
MKKLQSYLQVVSVGAVLSLGGSLFAFQDTQPKPDNTKMNKAEQPTADQQKMNASDRKLTQQVRKAIMADKSLSTYAHNVKVISQNGMVTLKGPVSSEDEKKTIETKATEVAGAGKVTNELTVASEGTKARTK